MTNIVLNYERAGLVVIDSREDDGIDVTVRTQRTQFRTTLRQCGNADIVGLLLAPLVWLFVLGFASRLPRIELSLSRQGLRIVERGELLGWSAHTRSWPLTDVGEIRNNRFDDRLFIRIPGKTSFDYFHDLEPEMVRKIASLLEDAHKRLSLIDEGH